MRKSLWHNLLEMPHLIGADWFPVRLTGGVRHFNEVSAGARLAEFPGRKVGPSPVKSACFGALVENGLRRHGVGKIDHRQWERKEGA